MTDEYENFTTELDDLILKYIKQKHLPKQDILFQVGIAFTSLVKMDEFERTPSENQVSRLEAMDLIAGLIYNEFDGEENEIYH